LRTDVRARTTTGARSGLRYLIYGFGLLCALLTASCGNSIFSVGTPVILLSAKPGRFTSYIVTIDQITLTRQDGTVVELPTINEQVDLANLKAYTNVLAAPAVATGTYVSATFLLDYVNPIPAYLSIDAGGHSLTGTAYDAASKAAAVTETVTVQFDPQNPFVIPDQKSAVLAIDIDLEASNIIGASNSDGTLQVTVKPFWNITTQPNYEKPVYARGLYVLADTNNSNFVMNVRPLHDILNQPFGAMTVNVDANTYYNVNGVTYVGAAGLAAISALTNVFANLQISAYGPPTGSPFSDLTGKTPAFTATQVYVGSSFESTLEDQITGVVAGISGTTVTVNGAGFVDRYGDYGFTEGIPVTVGPNTVVSVDGNANPASLSSLAVGQVVTVLGLGNAPNLVNYNPASLDATGSVVPGAQIRIQNTPLLAQFNSASSANDMSANVFLVNNFEPTYGTANASTNPVPYAITSPTDISTIAPGTWLKLNGMTTASTQSTPQYTATSVSTDVQQQLVIEWTGGGGSTPGSVNPFSVVNSNGIVVNLADAALSGSPQGVAQVRIGKSTINDLLAQPPPNPNLLTINFNTSDAQHPAQFGVGSAAVGAYTDTNTTNFANHTQIVADGTLPIEKLVAYGQYDATTGVFSATKITINAQ
jgi:hypothetical protein